MPIIPDTAPDQQQPAYDPADPWRSVWLLVLDVRQRVDRISDMLDQQATATTYTRARRLLTLAFWSTVALWVLLAGLVVAVLIIRPGGL